MSAEPYVMIETLRVDQRRLEARVTELEKVVKLEQPIASPAVAARLERAAAPSVRVLRGAQAAGQAQPPVPPIRPRVPSPPPAPPAAGTAAAPLQPAAGEGSDVLGNILGGLAQLLSSPDGAARLVRLGQDLEATVTEGLRKLVTDAAPELAHAVGEIMGDEFPPAPPPVPPPSAPASSPVDEALFGGPTASYTQTEQTRDTRV